VFLFFCLKSSEFRFRRKASEIRNHRAGTNNSPFGGRSISLPLQAPLADPARRRPPVLVSRSSRLAH
jgi:hypothetical protein